MLHIGCHLSSSKGFYAMGKTALSIGADTFQFFTRNPRGSRAKALNLEDVARLNDLMKQNAFAPIVAHAPYTINPCGADARVLEFARETIADDLRRLEAVDNCYYNFHPGSHVGQGMEAGISRIAETLDMVMFHGQRTTVLLETMAGKGSEVGSEFCQLREILNATSMSDKLGVCLDTCHVSDGGYDIIRDLDGVLTRFDQTVGLKLLKAIHLNDSKNEPGSRKDRHACIGEGTLGMEAMDRIINHPALRTLPFLLETPNELDGYAREIALLKNLFRES